MKRCLIPCLLLALLGACDDDDDLDDFERPHRDAGGDQSPGSGSGSGVCRLSECPTPQMGAACCTPLAECGMDPAGLGLNCVPNPDVTTERECVLDECPEPTVGIACCTPLALCGFDPFGSGQVCFAFPPPGTIPEFCDPAACPSPEGGFGCCAANGECGVDPFGIGWCFPSVAGGEVEEDAAVPEELPPLPPISTEVPDDPSITGECPSFLGFFGPVWGCCSGFGVCGTFAYDECLLPAGTELPVGPPDEDAGQTEPFLRCTPPAN